MDGYSLDGYSIERDSKRWRYQNGSIAFKLRAVPAMTIAGELIVR
ncbi:MAG TPA: hypothetical protein VGM92_12405 [Candidatus Kapabacteria bacterium]